jgi:predicted dehydrogenase
MGLPLRVGVIGVGSFGRNHARVYSDMDSVKLVAVCDASQENLQRVSKYGAKQYTDHREMLANENLDFVSLVVPTKLHHRIALDVLSSKVSLLVEKPIASTIEEAREIIACAKKNNVKLTVGHIERFNPAIIELKRRVDAGELGRVFRMHVSRLGPFPDRIRDVGVVVDLAVHDLDIARFIIGDEVDHLYARTEKRINTEHEDLLSAILTFKNKTIFNLNIDWLTPAKVRTLLIAGEHGQFVADYLTQELTFHENAAIGNNLEYSDIMRGVSVGRQIKFDFKKKEPLLAELEHFADCVANNREPLVSGMDGLKALELALALIESSNNNKVIMQ